MRNWKWRWKEQRSINKSFKLFTRKSNNIQGTRDICLNCDQVKWISFWPGKNVFDEFDAYLNQWRAYLCNWIALSELWSVWRECWWWIIWCLVAAWRCRAKNRIKMRNSLLVSIKFQFSSLLIFATTFKQVVFILVFDRSFGLVLKHSSVF